MIVAQEAETRVSVELEDVWINAEVVRVTPATPSTPLQVELATGHTQEFDALILATHSDTSLKILGQSASQVQSFQCRPFINPV